MTYYQRLTILVLRVSLGWLFFYSGITKILNPQWSSAGFLNNAETFNWFYKWFALSQNIGWVNFLNEWGQLFIGIALISGLMVKWASFGGMIMMLLYYFPGLNFPLVDRGFIVDDRIIYIFVFVLLVVYDAGKYWGLKGLLLKKKKLWKNCQR